VITPSVRNEFVEALVENFDARQSKRGIPLGASWMGRRLDRGKPVESSELSTLERTPFCRRTAVGWPPRNVGPNAALIRTPADDMSTDPAAARRR